MRMMIPNLFQSAGNKDYGNPPYPDYDTSGATFSHDHLYRYKLWRIRANAKKILGFIMLNPSTADEIDNDPTVARCLRRAYNLGYDGLIIGNMYAFRTTSPVELAEAGYPIGLENDRYLRGMAEICSTIVLGWGSHAKIMREIEVVKLIRSINPNLCHLGLTKAGQPRHPLYIAYDVEPIKYEYKGD